MKSNRVEVYFDDTIFVLQKIGGISIVFAELIQRLKAKAELGVHMVITGDSSSNLLFKNIAGELDKHAEPFKFPRSVLPFMPLLAKLPAGSIYHSTYHRYLYQKGVAKVLTVHDLGYEHGIMRHGVARMVHLHFKKIAIRKADAIVCVSENTRKDLEYFYSKEVKNKLIRVIYNGLSDEFLTTAEVAGSAHPYVLYVGARHPYKNFEMIVDAVARLDDFRLVIAGGKALSGTEQEHLERCLPGRFTVRPGLETRELLKVYQQAFCLVYPSSYEGFGLPVIEAMAAGCPVIACNNSSLPEIAGGAALLMDEPTPVAICQAICTLQNNEVRADLVAKGKEQARKFSWNTTATELTKLYQELTQLK
ncbi:glycosyltransferase family 4 protein [Arcticibacter sp.]|uniref:glycosyltransferase family 4 protein n=1 Tax=Arcticibacter sp. TaxID=1872630 RepID=UPI00388EF508